MKNIFISCLILLTINSYSQITLDFQTQKWYLTTAFLSDTETKYYDMDVANNQFSLYNLDGTLYKTIDLPPQPGPNTFFNYIFYISRTLFDNDPSNIEYLVEYIYDSSSNYHYDRTKIIREDGTILFDELYAKYNYIYPSEEGTKLMLDYNYANGYAIGKKIFSLPGSIPTSNQEKSNFSNIPFNLYPNPNNGSFFIKMRLKQGEENIIDLFSSNGVLIDTYRSRNNFLQINNFNLSEGIYFLSNRIGNSNSTRMIIKK